jgi:Tfp pilus assembly protein PilX
MNPKLKISLIRRTTSEQGFAMPVALGLGLIMALIGVTMIVRSQGDRVTSAAQKATASSLSAAETGIARYQSLINTNRPISMYPGCVTWASSGTACNDTGTTQSWGNAVTIPAYSNTCSNSASGSGAAVITAQASRDWQDVDPNDPTKGQFRLIDYAYTGTPGSPPGTGTLTVEGRINQTGSGSAATKDARTSTTQLQVTLPVVKNNRAAPIPGLWVTDNVSSTTMTQQQVLGNILIYGCQNNTQITQSNIAPITNTTTPSGGVYASKDVDFPVTPDLNSLSAYTTLSSTVYPADPNGIWSGQSNSQTSQHYVQVGNKYYAALPRRNSSGTIIDPKNSDGKYYYLVDTLTSPGGSATLFVDPDPTVQVIIMVRGKIDLSGGPTINSPGYPQKLQIYGNTYAPAGQTTATKYPCGSNLSATASPPTCPSLDATINGGGGISALILAPEATAAVSGGGGSSCANVNPPNNNPPSGNFVGAVWVKKYASSSSSSATVICAYGNFSDYVATAAAAQTPWAGIPYISNWQRKEANP